LFFVGRHTGYRLVANRKTNISDQEEDLPDVDGSQRAARSRLRSERRSDARRQFEQEQEEKEENTMTTIAMTAEQLETLVNSLSAAATTAAVAAAAVTAGSTSSGGYAEVPGGKGGDADTWNFSTGDGLKLFLHSTKGIEPKCDGKQEGLANFLRKIKRRGETFGWSEVFLIPDSNATSRSLCIEHGTLKSADVDKEVRTYCFQAENRRKQGSTVLAKLITESITDDLLMELLQKEEKFSIVEAGTTNDHESGAIMLHELINLVEIETRATIANITKQLNNLDLVMQGEKDSDIKGFNVKVDALLRGLRARNRSPPDIITSLFAAYKLAADSKFVEYIPRKEEEYEDGTDELKVEKLMSLALSKYKFFKGRNEWMKKTKQELQFVAMHSELEDTKKRLALATRGGGRGKGLGGDIPTKDKAKREDEASHRGARPGRPNTGQFAWKGIAPKAGEPNKKTVNGKSYYHCPHHGDTKWVLEFNREGIEHAVGCCARSRTGNDLAMSLTLTMSGSSSEAPSREDMRLAQALAHVMGDAADVSRLTEDDEADE